ncbi:MAG: hypothetical protein QW607_10815 [Desulfurococcaceae archaeon]
MTKKELELLRELAQKLSERRKALERKKTFQKVLSVLSEIPEIRGRIVQPTGNDYFGRSWMKGLIVSYRNRQDDWKRLNHKASVSYEHVFPHRRWKESTDKSIAEQLFDLFTEGVIDYDTEIRFEFHDWEDKTYDNSRTIVVHFKKIFPEVLQIVERTLPETEILSEKE